MPVQTSIFHRPDLARTMAGNIVNVGVGSAASSGLFLVAPRRTGKSTFVREDLRPALMALGALVLYVDLWSNTQANPAGLIVGTIRAELAKHEGVLTRLSRRLGSVSVGGVEFDVGKVGLGSELSLSDALSALSDEVKQLIVLVIDEAQHALTTNDGAAAMFALKAARDELNSSEHNGLRIVCTGSNRDKLAMLRNNKDQAFFSAPIATFPPLGKDYVEWFCAGAGLPIELDSARVFKLFQQIGNRPEILYAAADSIRFDWTPEANQLAGTDLFEDAVAGELAAISKAVMADVRSLTPIQSAVLKVMAAYGSEYAPFEAATLAQYRKAMVIADVEDAKCDVTAVQGALSALQDKKLVWRASRGVYSIEDDYLIDLLRDTGLLDGLESCS